MTTRTTALAALVWCAGCGAKDDTGTTTTIDDPATGTGATGTGSGATGPGTGATASGTGATGTGTGATGTGTGAPGTGAGASGTGTGATGTGTGSTPPVGCDAQLVLTSAGDALARDAVVRFGDPAAAAVACVADASEALLWESTTPATEHRLLLAGLRPDTDYTCTAVPVGCDGTPAVRNTRSGTVDAPSLTVTRHASLTTAGPPYTLINTAYQCSPDTSTRLWVFDPDGVARWTHTLPPSINLAIEARYHLEGIIWGGGYTPDFALQTVGLDHAVIDTLDDAIAPDAIMFHHDGKRLANGTDLMLAEVENTDGIGRWKGFRAIGLDGPFGDWSFDSQQLVDAGELPAGNGDAYHANWIDVVDGVLYVSLCFTDEILAIELSSGEVLWRLAPTGGLTLLDHLGNPLAADEMSQCQHGLEIRGDRVLVHDNGRWDGRRYSRAFELEIDANAGTATRRWLYTEPGWFENAMGDIDYLSDDRVWITMAHIECWAAYSDRTELVELDTPSGEVVQRITFDDPWVGSYRSERVDACDTMPHVRFCPGIAERMAALGL